MLRRHADLDIPEDKRGRFVQRAREAAEAVWSGRPDVVAAVVAYLGWGSRPAVENSRPGHVAHPDAGVPSWAWDD